VTSDRNSQTVYIIEPDLVHRPGYSVGQDDGFANKLGLSVVEFGKDGARARFSGWHCLASVGLHGGRAVAHEIGKRVADTRQRNVSLTLLQN
jgi:hypothetical protein